MFSAFRSLGVPLAVGLVGAACGTTLSVRPDFKPEDHPRVAIVPFRGEAGEEDQRGTLEGGIEQALITCGIDVIERGRVAEVVQERSEAIDYAQIGKVLGVQLIITGAAEFSWGGGVKEVTYRGVQADSGRVMFSGSLGGGGKPEGNGRDLGEDICKIYGRGAR